ncbi:hypothetical protein FS749_014864 [Ceratobasidium sp. UAMH 11750]|nr:hypothetical protein FS749_014864 [Ceratobasidium sp. UAMH 11750]
MRQSRTRSISSSISASDVGPDPSLELELQIIPPPNEIAALFQPSPSPVQTDSPIGSFSHCPSQAHHHYDHQIPDLQLYNAAEPPGGQSPPRSAHFRSTSPDPSFDPSLQRSRSSSPLGDGEPSSGGLQITLEPGNTPDMFERPSFIREHSSIRMTYLKAVGLDTVRHLNVRATNLELTSSLDCLWEAGLEIPTNPKPVKTLDTVHRRLGLGVDKFLKRQPVCSECYRRFSPKEITSAQSDKCYCAGYPGIFWRVKDGACHPIKCIVYTRLVAAMC